MEDRTHAQVLIVDEKPGTRKRLADALQMDGFIVESAANGREAMALVADRRPDLMVVDYYLSDETGMELMAQVENACGEVPAVIITGSEDAEALVAASRKRPIELMTRPVNLPRLRETLHREYGRLEKARQSKRRVRRLRRLARDVNQERKFMHEQLDSTCSDLAEAYQDLSARVAVQEIVMSYQAQLLMVENDADVFRTLFGMFVEHSGAVCGVGMACNEDADLGIVGRFGIPQPDSHAFCKKITDPVTEMIIGNPQCLIMDAEESKDDFDHAVQKYLPGMTIMAIPLMPSEGELIGVVVLYRKGEQPFSAQDMFLAEMIGFPTALALKRND
jgi:CheY-like chemotaxis protein